MNTPTKEEIEIEMYEAVDNKQKFLGMTYADGVEAALRWVLGETETKPMED